MSGPDDIYDGTVAEVRAMTEPTTAAGRRYENTWRGYVEFDVHDAILVIEAEAAADHEAALRADGWHDGYEWETATAMEYGSGYQAGRAAALDEARAAVEVELRLWNADFVFDEKQREAGISLLQDRIDALREGAG